MKVRVYLDTSTLNRIFDNQSQARIYLEATSVLVIFSLIEKQIVDIVSSDILLFENSKNPYNERNIFVGSVLKMAKSFQALNTKILKRAQELETDGIKGLDALHLACAEGLNVDYFITCDDKIIKKYCGKIEIKTPVEFITNILKENKDDTN